LRRRRRRPDDERVSPALGDVLGSRQADQGGGIVAHIVEDREQLEGRQRPDDDVDLVALDQLLRLGLGARRVAAGVGNDEVDLAAGQRAVLLLEEGADALLHLDAALGERAGLDREQADLERRALGDRRHADGGGGGAGRGARQELAAIETDSHCVSSLVARRRAFLRRPRRLLGFLA
jgi:hypothetical protein